MCLRHPRSIVDVFSRLSSLCRVLVHFCACMFAFVHFGFLPALMFIRLLSSLTLDMLYRRSTLYYK
jgi:hypothetical protein